MISAPQPEVVANDKAGGDPHHHLRPRLVRGGVVRAPYPYEDVMHEARVEGVTPVRAVPPLQQRLRRGAQACLQQDPRHAHAVDVPHTDGGGAPGRDEGSEADAEQNLAVLVQHQRSLQVVDTRGQDHMESNPQPLVDCSCGVHGPRNVNVLESDHRSPREVRAHAVALDQRDVQVVFAFVIHTDEGLLGDQWCGINRDSASLLIQAAMALRRTLGADKHHVPYSTLRALTKLRVACAVLLLAGGLELAADPHVADEPSAGVAHADALLVLGQVQVAVDDGAPDGRRLRGGPEHVAPRAEVLRAAPEGAQGAVNVLLVALLAVDAALRVEDDVARLPAQAEDLRVVPYGHVHRVLTWLEEEGKA
mmetsp:Transcript_121215/g.354311  ORF Transcript_121215/g.354311 Transcript_121215/m.354311 type:complete len:364 (-) Transcript_121215:205-1296(-)